MTTAPEQLQAWQEEAKRNATEWWNADHKLIFTHSVPNGYEAGYLRAKQETEQAIKDERKQTLEDVAEGFIKQKSWLRDYAYAVVEHAATEGATQ